MPISALVVTIDEHSEAERVLLRSIAELPGVTCGGRVGGRVPVVLETDTLVQSRRTFDAIRDLPGVLALDLVQLNFEDVGP